MRHKNIAVVGGGIAGLYAAWRILNSDPTSTVHLFECSKRVGGRIKSVFLPHMPFAAELGAMRFRNNHRLLKALLDELRIPTRPFDVRPPRIRVRGRSLSAKELKEGICRHCGAGVPYILRASERGQSAEELVQGAIRRLLRDLSFPGLSQGAAQRAKQKILDEEISSSVWSIIKQHGWYENTPLYKIGFWNLLQHYLSGEAFQLVHDALSLESVLGNWSAAEAIPWFMSDFSSSELFMVPDGMEQVPSRIFGRLRNQLDEADPCLSQESLAGVADRFTPVTGTEVHACRRTEAGWKIEVSDQLNDAHGPFDCVILALPKAALEKILILDLEREQPWKPKWLSHVQAHVLYKLFLLYEREWWMGDDAPGYSVGRTYTDLPVRQVYYFSPQWMRDCARMAQNSTLRTYGQQEERTNDWSLVMASYSDEHYVDFWRPFSGDDNSAPYYKPPTSLTLEQEEAFRAEVDDKVDPTIRANERIIKKVQQQLVEIHGHIVPEPILGLYQDWGQEPFGAGWHTWNVGTKPWEFKPYKDDDDNDWPPDLYVCGEAFSAEQGWIEGALKTVERVLIRMEVPEPSYQHGWPVENLKSYVGEPGDDHTIRQKSGVIENLD